MRPPDQPNESDLEVTSLDPLPTGRRPRGWPQLSKRWRVALAVCAIALAVVAPLVSLAPTRAVLRGLLATPTPEATPSPTVSDIVTIVPVPTGPTDVAPSQWATLRARPLRLPELSPGAACPTAQGRTVQASYGSAIGSGPAYIIGMGTDGVLHATGPVLDTRGAASWGNQFSLFIIDPTYSGAVLARGHQIDGSHALLFNGGIDQRGGFTPATSILLGQLRLEGGEQYGSPWATWMAYLRMQAPGCYAIQLDGLNFSEIVIFRVVFGQ